MENNMSVGTADFQTLEIAIGASIGIMVSYGKETI